MTIENKSVADSNRLYSIEYDDAGGPLTPDINQSLIDLYRSFSFGNIVAFVGSGASASLGHCRWNELAERLARAVVTGICKANGIEKKTIQAALDDFPCKDKKEKERWLLQFKKKSIKHSKESKQKPTENCAKRS